MKKVQNTVLPVERKCDAPEMSGVFFYLSSFLLTLHIL